MRKRSKTLVVGKRGNLERTKEFNRKVLGLDTIEELRKADKVISEKLRKEKKREHSIKAREKQAPQRDWFKEFKSKLKCIHCSENHPAVIQFHHRDPSEGDRPVSSLIGNRERLMAELEKCDVLCANCHAKIHWRGEEKK